MNDKVSQFKFTIWDKQVPDSILDECAKLFSENYGKWSCKGSKPGEQITLQPKRLRSEFLFDSTTCSVITATTIEDELVGHACICYFPFRKGSQF